MWNNILHNIYERMVNVVLDKADPILLEALLDRANLIQILIDSSKEEDVELPG